MCLRALNRLGGLFVYFYKQNVFKGGFLLTKIKSMSWRGVCAVVSFGLFSAPVVSDICEVE